MAVAGPSSAIKKDANVAVQAFADRTAAAPGEVVNLLISLTPEKEWHVYWRGPGGLSGLPTTIDWSGPAGFVFGRAQFPIPKRSVDELNDTSFILEGEALMVTTVRVPTSAEPGKDAQFKAKVSYLACKKECIPGDVEVSLALPIVSTDSKSESANAELFGRAARRFPLPVEKAKHVKLTDRTDKPQVKSGDKFTVSLVAELAAGHHMQSNKPSSAELIPAVLFLEPTEGLEIGEVVYPPAQERTDKLLGKLSEYAGEVTLTIPVSVAEDAGTAPRFVRGVFQYQICNDSGTCFPPQHIEIAIPVQIVGGPAPTTAILVAPPVPVAVTDQPEPASVLNGADVALPTQNILTRAQNWLLGFGYLGALLVAVIGGFVLNLMPCVLPVISLKILSFVRQAHEHRARVFWLGMTYSAGIMVFFSVIGVLFWQTNKQLGWGEQFQKPQVVIGLAAIVTAFALSLFEVFMIFPPKIINKLDEKAEGEGFLSAFVTGLLATFLGTACTAPFLSAAIGAASKFSPTQGGFIFVAVGVGMALPFMVLAANPGWLRFVPRAGPWMTTFEYLMGFLLLGTVIWLLNPLRGQIGGEGVLLAMIFLLTVAMAAWIKGKIEFGAPTAKRVKLYGLALTIVLLGWLLPFRFFHSIDDLIAQQIQNRELMADGQLFRQTGQKGIGLTQRKLDWTKGIPWQHYKRDRALEDVRNGYTVFIDYTADWCANCKVMLKTAIERPDVMAVMRELNVIPYTADYTLPVREIKEDLERYQRGGVPVFVVYRPNDTDKPEILPEVITQTDLIEALRRAGPSRIQVAAKP